MVAVLVVSTVALPVVENAQDAESTVYNNNTGGRFLLADENMTFTSSFVGNASTITFNDVELSRTNTTNTLLVSDLGIVWYNNSSTGSTTVVSSSGTVEATTETVTIAVDNNTVSVSVGSNAVISGTASWIVVADSEGTFVTTARTQANYANSVNDFIVYAYNNNAGVMWAYDGMTSADTTIVATSSEAVEGYTDLYKITGVTLTKNGVSDMPYTFLCPVSVHAHTETNNTHIALLGAALLMLFLVPLMMVVNMIRGRSD